MNIDTADAWLTTAPGLRLHGAAACADTPEVFLPHPDLDAARRVCGGCSQAAACLAYALRHDVTGVWAGTTDDDRRDIRRRRHIPEPRPVSAELDELVLAWRRPTNEDDHTTLSDDEIAAMAAAPPETTTAA